MKRIYIPDSIAHFSGAELERRIRLLEATADGIADAFLLALEPATINELMLGVVAGRHGSLYPIAVAAAQLLRHPLIRPRVEERLLAGMRRKPAGG
jgi:hypothetical protein